MTGRTGATGATGQTGATGPDCIGGICATGDGTTTFTSGTLSATDYTDSIIRINYLGSTSNATLLSVSDNGTGRFKVSKEGVVTTTSDVNASGTVTANRLVSSVATGTAPLSVSSTTKVTNLNADLLDGLDSSAFASASHNHDAAYVNVTGDTMTGPLTVPGLTSSNGITVMAGLINFPPNSLPGGALADGSVTTSKITPNAVDSSRIADGTIIANDIANATITAGKISDTAKAVYVVALSGNADCVGSTQAAIATCLSKAATSGGGIVYLKAGTYSVTSTLSIPSNTILKGERGSVLRADANITVVNMANPFATLEGVTVDMSGVSAVTAAVWVAADDITVQNIRVVSTSSTPLGVWIWKAGGTSNRIRIQNNQFSGSFSTTYGAIMVDSNIVLYDSIFANNLFEISNSASGIFFNSGGNRISVSDNVFNATAFNGASAVMLNFKAYEAFSVRGNIIRGFDNGVRIGPAAFISASAISGNTIAVAGSAGILLEPSADDIDMSGNRIGCNGLVTSHGVQVTGGGSDHQVSGNSIRNCGVGISLIDTAYSTIASNNIHAPNVAGAVGIIAGYYAAVTGNYIEDAQLGIAANRDGWNQITGNTLNNNNYETGSDMPDCAGLTDARIGICLNASFGTVVSGNRIYGYTYGIASNVGAAGGAIVTGNGYDSVSIRHYTPSGSEALLVGGAQRSMSISGQSFVATDETNYTRGESWGYTHNYTYSKTIYTEVPIPTGAIIRRIGGGLFAGSGNITCGLYYQAYGLYYNTTFTVATFVGNSSEMLRNSTTFTHKVNADANHYFVRCSGGTSGAWISALRIEYYPPPE